MDLTLIVPLFNEEESLPELEGWIRKVADSNSLDYEIIMIDDGSRDHSWEVVEELAKKNSRVRGIKFRRNYGKSAALHVGFEAARGDVVITMDADLQDSPDEIPELYRMIKEEGFDIVSGWKKKRNDPISKTIPSKFYNYVVRVVSGIKLHDFNCGLKAYRNAVVKSVEVYGDMHRYIPLLAKWAGYRNIGEKVVEHHARKYGYSKFGMARLLTGFLDLLSVVFVGKFRKSPMQFLGTLGSIFFFVGFVILAYLSYMKIIEAVYKIHERPIFYFGMLTLVIGTQLFLSGFLGELIGRNSPSRNAYLIEERINEKDSF